MLVCWCVGVGVGPGVGVGRWASCRVMVFRGENREFSGFVAGRLALVLDPQVRRFCRTKTNLKSFKYGGMCC